MNFSLTILSKYGNHKAISRFTVFRRMLLSTLSLFLLIFSPPIVFAECMFFDMVNSHRDIPYFIRGEVVEATSDDELSSCLAVNGNGLDEKCKYSFKIKVKEYLKGESEVDSLKFQYGYWIGCPGVDTFGVGKEYIFAVKIVNEDGFSTLSGHNCGNYILRSDETERITQLRNNLKNSNQEVSKQNP